MLEARRKPIYSSIVYNECPFVLMLKIYGLVGKASNVTTKKASNRNQPFWKMFKSNKEYIAKHSLLGKKGG